MGGSELCKDLQSIALKPIDDPEAGDVSSTGKGSPDTGVDEPRGKVRRWGPSFQHQLRSIEDASTLWCQEYILRRLLRLRVILQTEDERHIELDVTRKSPLIDDRTGKEHIGNAIRSSRYTLWNFIPCQLWFQFSKIANFYFLITGILQLIPGLSTTGTYTTILPLIFFLSFSIGREGYDDFRRYRLDRVENKKLTRVLYGYRPGGVEGNMPWSWTDTAERIWDEMRAGLTTRFQTTAETTTRSAEQGEFSHEGEPNAQRADDLNASPWATVRWMDLRVGDVIELKRNDQVPADIVLLSANGRDGIAYIETMALDGETNLKRKQPQNDLAAACKTLDDLSRCQALFVVESPNRHLHKFEGKLCLGVEAFPITLNNVVCRGSVLRNTPQAIGIVVNTGEESKMRMNASHAPKGKAPAMQAMTNRVVIILTVYLLLLSAGCTAGYEIWTRVFEDEAWYLANSHLPLEDISIAFVIEFNNLIPLALYVSMEIIKFAQFLLLQDVEMYDEESDTPMVANTQTIFENLGQVNHVFTDKTGTLTENVMRFRKMSVAGTVWQHSIENLEQIAVMNTVEPHVTRSEKNIAPNVPVVNVLSVDEDEIAEAGPRPLEQSGPGPNLPILEHLRTHPGTALAQKIQLFLLSLALCHTCFPETQHNGEITFQAESPDEFALVEAAREFGFLVAERNSRSIQLLVRHPDSTTVRETYEVLDIIEFSSNRKRMSIIVRFPDGRICIFCKGADTVVQQRLRLKSLAKEKAAEVRRVHHQLSVELARDEILRKSQDVDVRGSFSISRKSMDISVIGRKSMGRTSLDVPSLLSRSSFTRGRSAVFDNPHATLQARSISRTSNDQKSTWSGDGLFRKTQANDLDEGNIFEQCFQHIDEFATEGLRTLLYGYRFIDEKEYTKWHDIYLHATTNLIDRQTQIEAAGEMIERDLELAGATAIEDKLQKEVPETIEKLRRAHVKIWMLSGDKRETAVNIAHSSRICKPYSRVIVLDQNSSLQLQIDTALLNLEIGNIAHSVVVIDGRTLDAFEGELLTAPLYDLLLRVNSVICCRATPSQKAGMVKAVRRRVPKSMTLAIGDGGNDIAMIQEAHVGIGISGKEGLQAARIADYSIAQFRFLQRLLFVHGHWNYDRTAKYVLSTFWKEMMFYSVQLLYQRWNGYTGTSLYENDSLAVYNTLFTSLAVMLPGIFEQDLKAATLLAVPELYRYGQESRGFNMTLYGLEMLIAAVESLLVYFMIFGIYGLVPTVRDNGLFAFGDLAFTVCVLFINIKLLVLQYHYKTWVPTLGAFITIGGWFVWNLFLSAIYTNSPGEVTVYRGLTQHFGNDPVWWAVMVIVLTTVLLLELTIDVLRKIYRPSLIHTWQVLEQNSEIKNKLENMGGVGGYGIGDSADVADLT